MTTKHYPTKVERHDQRSELEITWQDGGRSVIPYAELRGYCPCAGCQGHMVREIRFRPARAAVQPLVVSAVGNYALSILWSDSHSTGIYRFDFLADIPNRTRERLARETQHAEQDGSSQPN